MGTMTRGNIVSAGLTMAGNTGITGPAATYLNAWLGSVYASWPWPFLSGRWGPFSIAQGSQRLTVGAGSNTSDLIQSIDRISTADTNQDGWNSDQIIYSADSAASMLDPIWTSANSRGAPSSTFLQPSSVQGQWHIDLSSIADKGYRIFIQGRARPADLTSDAQSPMYPNDLTMIHAIYVYALRHQQDERWGVEDQNLGGMLAADRVKYGKNSGRHQRVGLARHRFR